LAEPSLTIGLSAASPTSREKARRPISPAVTELITEGPVDADIPEGDSDLIAGQAGLAATVAVGLCSAGAQAVMPFAAPLPPEALRGRIIGDVMPGLLAGTMPARPVASLVAPRGFNQRP
jgi:hypothetical protein